LRERSKKTFSEHRFKGKRRGNRKLGCGEKDHKGKGRDWTGYVALFQSRYCHQGEGELRGRKIEDGRGRRS